MNFNYIKHKNIKLKIADKELFGQAMKMRSSVVNFHVFCTTCWSSRHSTLILLFFPMGLKQIQYSSPVKISHNLHSPAPSLAEFLCKCELFLFCYVQSTRGGPTLSLFSACLNGDAIW